MLSLNVFSSQFTDDYGIVIAGGAAPVFESVGFLQALGEEGFIPTEYVGTSMGSLVSYFLAAGYQPKDIIDVFKIIEYDEFFELVWPLRGGFIHYDNFIDLVYSITKVNSFEDFRYPIKLGVQNFSDFNYEYWYEGNSLNALRASIALEVFFEPFKYNNKYYADVGVTDLFVKEANKYFSTDKIFMIRVKPKLFYDPNRNFYNLINILYATVDLGGYHTNALYSELFLDYDYIFELELEESIDPKSFFYSEKFYDIGYEQGKFFLKNQDIFDEFKIEKKEIDYKPLDFEKLYLNIKTENYYLPRNFYYNLKTSLDSDDYIGNIFLYMEFMNNRLEIGYNLNNELQFIPYFDFKNYYFPFRNNRFDIYMDNQDNLKIMFRTYLIQEFRNILYVDYNYIIDNDKTFNELDLVYDNLYQTYKEDKGYLLKGKYYFYNSLKDFDFYIKKNTDFKNIKLSNEIGIYLGDNYKIMDKSILSDFNSYKLYSKNIFTYYLFRNMNIELNQLFFINDLKTNLYYNLYYDDGMDFGSNIGFDLEVPVNIAGVTDFNLFFGLNNIDSSLNFYINFKN